MSQKDRRNVMKRFAEMNAPVSKDEKSEIVLPPESVPDNQQNQTKMSLLEAVQMFGAQMDNIKNNLIGIIMKQDVEIKRLTEELKKKKG